MESVSYTQMRLMDAARSFRRLIETYGELISENKISETDCFGRTVIAQMEETASILEEVSGTGRSENLMDEESMRKLAKCIKMSGLSLNNVFIMERKNGRKQLVINTNTIHRACITSKELAGIISYALGKEYAPVSGSRLVVSGNQNEFVFEEAPRYKLLSGFTRMSKEGSRISGDNFAFVQPDAGKAVMSIADGMGTGFQANKTSSRVMELLEQFVEAGFSEQTAVSLINSTFATNDWIGNPVTIDLTSIDTYTGMCGIIKMGAAATFIKRDNGVEIVRSSSLPAGVIENVEYDYSQHRLENGNFVIMVSDGIVDALPFYDKEEQLAQIIDKIEIRNPDMIARVILDEAMFYQDGGIADDMTVLVAGIWDKTLS